MAEYIEREAAKLCVKEHYDDAIIIALDKLPAADVVPVRHGRWIQHMESIETTVITASRVYEKGDSVQYGFTCSECGRWEENREPFCNCGAKMQGDANE